MNDREYIVGETAEFSKTISESDIYLFAGITGDMNPLHIDRLAASKSFIRERIAHGALVNGMISTVIGMRLPGPGTVYMEQDSRFLKPVYIGDTVRTVVEIDEILNKEKGVIKLKTYVMNQKGEMVLSGFAVVKVPKGEGNEAD